MRTTQLVGMLALLCACPGNDDVSSFGPPSTEVPSTIRDTSGATFEARDGDIDQLVPSDGTVLPPDCATGSPAEAQVWLGDTGLAMICLLDPETGGPSELMCRPIACDVSQDCVPGFSCDSGVCWCRSGACRSVDGHGRVEDRELIALCFGNMPRSTNCPAELDALSVYVSVSNACEDSSDDLCSVPEECE